LSQQLRERLRSRPAVWRRLRRLRLKLGAVAGSRRVAGISGPVHFNDLMLASRRASHVAHYNAVATKMLGHIERHVEWAEATPVIDIGSGYGRLLRHLVGHVEPSRIWACDTDAAAIEFCRAAFGVEGCGSITTPGTTFPEPFGLVVALTVLTNLPRSAVEAIVARLADITRPGGLVVITTHGWDSVHRHLPSYGSQYPALRGHISDALDAEGTCFVPYPHHRGDLGMAWHTPGFVRSLFDGHRFDLVEFIEAGLDDHQDVHIIRRRA